MSEILIGTCSRCGGQVTMSGAWYGTTPQVPSCNSCRATAKPRGPVIEMNEPTIQPQLLNEDRRN